MLLGRCYTRQFFLELVSQFRCAVATQVAESLPSVTFPKINMSRNVFVAVIIARSRTDFYFWQQLRQQKNCETCSFQSMFITLGNLRDKLLIAELLV